MTRTAITAALLAATALPAMAEEWDVSPLGRAPRLHRACREAGRARRREDRRRVHAEHLLWRPVQRAREPRRHLHRRLRDGAVLRRLPRRQEPLDHRAGAAVPRRRHPRGGARDLQALYRTPPWSRIWPAGTRVLLMPSPLPQYNLVGTGDVPASLADLRGPVGPRHRRHRRRRCRRWAPPPPRCPPPRCGRRWIPASCNAVSFAPHAHMSFGTVEAADWWTTNLNPGTVNCPVVVNTDALEALSDEHREALLGSRGRGARLLHRLLQGRDHGRLGPAPGRARHRAGRPSDEATWPI